MDFNNVEPLNLGLDSFSVANSTRCDVEELSDYINRENHGPIKLISQNIRSIHCNLSNFSTLITRSKVDWDIMVFTECWLRGDKPIPALQGYNYIATSVHKSQNEGVVVYYKSQLKVKPGNISLCDANCIVLYLNSDTCIMAIYRPPSQQNTTNFFSSLDKALLVVSTFKNIVFCGDINIDIIPNTSDNRSHEYLNLLASHGLLPAHTFVTHGHTCLDHMFLKTKLEASCYVVESSITDHEAVALNINLNAQLNIISKPNSYINFETLDSSMQIIDFQSVLNSTDANEATDNFISLLIAAIKKNSKCRKISRRKRVIKPWITSGLLRCMRNRDNLYKKLKKDITNEVLRATYKRYRNFCNSQLKKAKRNYDKQEIVGAKGNNKKLWEVIKNITGQRRAVDYSSNLLSAENPNASINTVNNFFVNVGKNLAETSQSKISNSTNNSISLTVASPVNSLVLLPTDELEIFHLILNLKDNCAVGIDQISGKFLKRYAHLLIPAIVFICNLALSTGVFPQAFKTALIKPVHKDGDRDCVNNFRPISILPTLSKILERLINKRLVHYLESNNLLSQSQFGFRAKLSTSDAVHELTSSIIQNLDIKRKCATIFLDLAKAFDTVSIPHLLDKLNQLGVRGIPLKLFQDYLTNRMQRVKIDNLLSDEQLLTYGVPQGSVVGPTLFLVYIDGLCRLQLEEGRILTFADDTALFFSGASWKEVFSAAQKGFDSVSSWLHNNMLTLNVSKTKYIAFAIRSNFLPPTDMTITAHGCNTVSTCACPTLTRTDKIKYLGITIDQSLSFKPHIAILVTRLRKLIYIFKALRHVADHHTIREVYGALCQSVVEYCITSWGGAAKTHLIEIERAQRAILKVSACLPFRYPTTDLYRSWDVFTVRQSFVLRIVLKQHSITKYDPGRLKDKRRRDTVCQAQPYHTSLSRNFFHFIGPFLYNRLNKKLSIFHQNNYECKKCVTAFLKNLTYEDTEKLLSIIS